MGHDRVPAGRGVSRPRALRPAGLASLAPLLGLGLVLACIDGLGRRPLGEPCAGDGSCEAGLVCLYGRCRQPCVTDRDCPGGACLPSAERPGVMACTLPSEVGTGADCPAPLELAPDGACRPPCAPGGSCPAGSECGDDGFCRGADAGDADGDADADGDGSIEDAGPDADGDGSIEDAGPDADADADLPVVAAGAGHTCALLPSGPVRCWGLGRFGQLGHASTESIGDDETPESAGDVPLGGDAIAISAGGAHSCALLATGAVRCWGAGGDGRLGYGNAEDVGDDETPESAGDVPIGGRATAVSAGSYHSCGLLETGAVRCWGAGGLVPLGHGGTEPIGDDETPASAGDVPLGGRATAISAGGHHVCALLETGAVRCWGQGGDGQLGYGNAETIGDDETPASAGDVPLGGRAIAVSAGLAHTCALLETGAVRCWGLGLWGRLGYGSTETIGDDETPASAGDVPLGGRAAAVSAGSYHTCAVLETGAVRCWGQGALGRLGHGSTETIGDDETPASAGDVPLGGAAIAVSAGGAHGCAVLATGAVRCWGAGDDGRLGYGSTEIIGDDETPASAGDVPLGTTDPES